MDTSTALQLSSVYFNQRHDDQLNRLHGTISLTPHHIVFTPSTTPQPPLQIALTHIHSITKSPPTHTNLPTPITITTRTFDYYDLLFSTVVESEKFIEEVKRVVARTSQGGIEARYAFSVKTKEESTTTSWNGWTVYDAKEEFERMGIGKRTMAWRVSDINKDYKFCPSYPSQIVVPSKISDTTLSYAVKYRSKSRIPGLVYLHWANLGSITRSSQPMVGITQTARSIQDEKLIEAIFSSHGQHSSSPSTASRDENVVYGATATNVIIDARPTKNAYANSVKGAGTENMSNYKNCRKEYLGIDNIHVMRNSLNGVFEALSEAESTGHLDRNSLRRTNWLTHLTNILEGTLIVIRTIHLSNSHVLVHCSDGWDRTSQLSSLPQICLDPYYRTAKGLAVLIEKDWVQFGHKFMDRNGLLCNDRVQFVNRNTTSMSNGGGGCGGGGGNGHPNQDSTSSESTTSITTPSNQSHPTLFATVQKQFTFTTGGGGTTTTSGSSSQFKETCPVFQQFLDCIYQIQRQFPDRFEWDVGLLKYLVGECYRGNSGSFLFNSEEERERVKARERTTSVWEEVFDLVETKDEVSSEEGGGGKTKRSRPELKLKEKFRNPRYDPSLDHPTSKLPNADQGVLIFDPQNVKWWFELFGRSDEEMNWKPPPPTSPLPPSSSTNGTETEHRIVTDAKEDPVTNPLSTLLSASKLDNSSSSSSSTNLSPPQYAGSRSTSPSNSDGHSSGLPPQPQQLAETVQKFGWSAWKSVQKFGQEAAKQYKERTAEPSSSSLSSFQGGEEERNGGGGGDSTSGLWSRFSTVSNPWSSPEDTSNIPPSSSTISSSSTPSYKPYQPRSKPSPTSSYSSTNHVPQSTTSSQVPAHPILQPSSALSINPWETISREDAVPTPLATNKNDYSKQLPPAVPNSNFTSSQTLSNDPLDGGSGRVSHKEEIRTSGGDPLGVGL